MKNILILLLLGSCAFIRPKPELSETSKEVPEWVYSPYANCSESSELCASGESKTMAQADAQARNNLASIFEVQVNSQFSAQTDAIQNFQWQGKVQEEVHQSLNESVNQILETVQIKSRYKDKSLSYSLASLDRVKASELIGARLKKLDDELGVLWGKRSRLNLRKIMRNYLEREKLNERYSIVSGQPKISPVSYREILDWRQSKPQREDLALSIGQAPDWMSDKLKELLTESGFKLVKGDASKAISLNVDSIKEYLNVEGFEKYTFTVNMTSFRDGEKNKVLSISETVTGRSQKDALLKVKSLFNDYIEQHLSDLNLD